MLYIYFYIPTLKYESSNLDRQECNPDRQECNPDRQECNPDREECNPDIIIIIIIINSWVFYVMVI